MKLTISLSAARHVLVSGLILLGAMPALFASTAPQRNLSVAPPIESLRALLIRNFSNDQAAVTRYRHTERVIEKKDGKVTNKTQLVWYVHGHAVSEITGYDNTPLNPDQRAEEHRKALQRARQMTSREPAPVGVIVVNHKQYPFAKLASDYVYGPGKVMQWHGRTVWVYPAEPNPNTPDRSREEEVLLSSRGEIWVDAEDLHVVRIQIHTFEPVRYWLGVLATVHQAELDLELQRYAPGVWLPETADFSFQATVLLFKHMVRSKTQIFSDYVPVETK
jgi:hypothetical protein